MMLIILDKDPVKSAQLLPDKIKFKQLIELCQLICSAGISNVYKPIKQGKHLQNWILKNPIWTKKFAIALYELCKSINMSKSTMKNIIDIISSIPYEISKDKEIETAIFRYSKDYECKIFTNTELPIEECIKQYKKYIEWKKKKNVKGY